MDLLIEQKTNYAYKLKYLEDASFDNIKNLAWNFINDLPKELVNELYEELDGGVVAIENEPPNVSISFLFWQYASGKTQ